MARSSDPKKLALWQGRFRCFFDSGLAVARFCVIEHVSESSFYYWQKRLGPQARRRRTRAEDRGACSEDRSVFQPVTVVPAVCSALVRLGCSVNPSEKHGVTSLLTPRLTPGFQPIKRAIFGLHPDSTKKPCRICSDEFHTKPTSTRNSFLS